MLAGALLGIFAVSAKILEVFPMSKHEALNVFFFVPGSVFLALFGGALVTRVTFVVLSQGKDIGSIEDMIGDPPARNPLEKMVLGGYFFFFIPAISVGGFFAGCWITLLVSGQIWALVSR